MEYSQDQIELKAHIEAQNAEIAARYSNNNFSITADLDHWAEGGITTVKQYEHYMAVAAYIDLYKDVNGIKPRHTDFDLLSTDEIYSMVDSLTAQAHCAMLSS